MTEPRRWTLEPRPYFWTDRSHESDAEVTDGPFLAPGEKVEVIEALPGVIIDLLPEDMRGDDAPRFSAYRPAAQRDPSPREAMQSVFTPTFGDARSAETPRFFVQPPSDPQPTFRARRLTLSFGKWTITIERRSDG